MLHCSVLRSLVFLFLFCIASVVSRSVSISKDESKNHKKTYIEGQGVLIPCNTTESSEIKVWWTKNESHSQFYQEGIVLRFNVVNRKEAGTYLCHAQNLTTDTNETVVDYVILNIEYPAEATYFYTSAKELRENGSLTIYAEVVGNPNPTYEVRNNDTGRRFMSANLHASFSIGEIPVRCEDMGLYMVTGHNKLNNGNFTKSEFVTVYCSPRPVYDNTYLLYSPFGREVRLFMKSVGYPYPEFRWFHFGSDVTSRSRRIDNHVTELYIDRLTIGSAGNYTLQMSNDFGSYTAVYTVVPRGPPGKPSLEIVEVLIHSVKLRWHTGYDYGTYTRFHVMKLIGNQYIDVNLFDIDAIPGGYQWVDRMVTGLTSNTSYRMIVVGQNSHGLGEFSNEVHFSTMVDPTPHYQYSDEINPLMWAIPLGIFIFLVVIAALTGVVCHRKMRRVDKAYEATWGNQEKKKIIN